MALDDAEVKGGIADEGELCLGFHAVAFMQNELELLLVDGSGRQQSGFHTPTEPLGHGTFNMTEMLDALLLRMGIALVGSIAQSDYCHQRFTVKHLVLVGLLLVGQAPRSPEFAIREARISAFAMRNKIRYLRINMTR